MERCAPSASFLGAQDFRDNTRPPQKLNPRPPRPPPSSHLPASARAPIVASSLAAVSLARRGHSQRGRQASLCSARLRGRARARIRLRPAIAQLAPSAARSSVLFNCTQCWTHSASWFHAPPQDRACAAANPRRTVCNSCPQRPPCAFFLLHTARLFSPPLYRSWPLPTAAPSPNYFAPSHKPASPRPPAANPPAVAPHANQESRRARASSPL